MGDDFQFIMISCLFLQIRGFIRLWDNFVGHHCDFEKFTIHYPDLPMHTPFGFVFSCFVLCYFVVSSYFFFCSKGYFRKGDDGIFAMKYMKIWDPCRNIMSQFSSRHINDFRVRYAYDIVMSKHTTP